MAHHAPPAPNRRRRGAPLAVLAGVVATAGLAMSFNGTLAGFTAQITNSINTTATGNLIMQETSGGVTCNSTDAGTTSNSINTNTATCSTINKYGGATTLVPGGAGTTTTVVIKNTGTVPAATFTLAPGACTQATNPVSGSVPGSAADLCSKIDVVITQAVGGATATTISPASSTAASLAAGAAIQLTHPLAAGATATYAFTVSLDPSAGNTYQGLQASQPLVWQFSS